MMPKFGVLAILVLNSLVCHAQKNRLSVTTNNLTYFNANQVRNNPPNSMKTHYLYTMPVLGYNRLLTDRMGLTFKLGYLNSNVETNENGELDTYSWNSTVKLSNLRYHFEVGIFEQFKLSNFLFTVSADLPVTYVVKENNFYQQENQFFYDPEVTYNRIYDNLYAKSLLVGIFMTGNISHKIYKNLYGGVELGIGIQGRIQFGKATLTERIQSNQGISYENIMVIDYNKFRKAELAIRPAISIFYAF